jgi:hypothetical protein
MFEAVEEGYAGETPARVHSGFLIRVHLYLDGPGLSRWAALRIGGPGAIGPGLCGIPRILFSATE